VSSRLSSFKPSKETAIKAMAHLSGSYKNELFSSNIHTKCNAIGNWYEVVQKLNDALKKDIHIPEIGQDGLYYDKKGAIVARGNGQDLGELDIIITNDKGEIVFAEITYAKHNLESYKEEIEYKQRLLSAFFNRKVEFLVISPVKFGKLIGIKRISNMMGGFLVITENLEELLQEINLNDISSRYPSKDLQRCLLSLSDLRISPINYLELHNRCRLELINSTVHNQTPTFEGNLRLVKRVLVGCLDETSIIALLMDHRIIFQEKEMTSEGRQFFSKVILSFNLPELRPVLYFRVRRKFMYLKMGPNPNLVFKFERSIFPNNAFFNWLDTIQIEIDNNLMNLLLNKFLTKDLARHPKKGFEPKISQLLKHRKQKQEEMLNNFTSKDKKPIISQIEIKPEISISLEQHYPIQSKILKVLEKYLIVSDGQLALETNLTKDEINRELEFLIRNKRIKIVETNSAYSPITGKVEELRNYSLNR
jgi:hypothetical protein